MLPQLAAITPTYIETLLRGAFGGSHIQAWGLFDLMEDTWPRLSKNINELKRAVQEMTWNLDPWREEDEPATDSAKEKMAVVSSAIWGMRPDATNDEAGFRQTIYDVMDGWAKGTVLIEIIWQIRDTQKYGTIAAPKSTVWIRPDNYAWTSEGKLGLNLNSLESQGNRGYALENNPAYSIGINPSYATMGGINVVELPPDKFLLGINKAKSGHPLACSLLRPLAWWWCASNFSADWLMNRAQLFGLPFRWGTYPVGASQATIDKICTMLDQMGSAAWAAFPEGAKLELYDGGAGAEKSPQADLLDRADKNCDLLILGQTLTTEQGDRGSQALGRVHSDVKQEVVVGASGYAAEVFNTQLIPAILRLNYGNDDECPQFKPESEKIKDEKANADRDKVLLDAGVKMPRDWFYKRHDIPIPQEGEEVVEIKQQTSQTPQDQPPADTAFDVPIKDTTKAAAKNGHINGLNGRANLFHVEPYDSPSKHFTTSALHKTAVALASDLDPVMKRLEKIMAIKDPSIMVEKLKAFVGDIEGLKSDLNADPAMAHQLYNIIGTGLARGMAKIK